MYLRYSKGYTQFYTDAKLTRVYADLGNRQTHPDSLANRTFTVIDVIPVTTSYGDKSTTLVLKSENGKMLYFNKGYGNGAVDFEFPNLKLPADYYCSYIKKENNPKPGTVEYFAEQQYSYKLTKVI